MKHYGDITKLNGAELPIVDIITGGSPCQDLSVAGKRAGLSGERSGLFMEQIRIVKEMREHDKQQRSIAGADVDLRLVRPRYMVWENVPGAFSSNKGEDFRCVLEEICRIADKTAIVPMLEGGGKWSTSGCIMGDGWSVAWRVHDAQFWGVPQRRRRIALVADFGGQTAPEILFERESMSGDIKTSGQTRESTPGTLENRAVESISFQERAGKPGGARESSYNMNEQEHCQHSTTKVFCLQGNGIDRADTAGCNGKGWRENESYTLNTIDRPAVAYSFDSMASNSMKSSNPNSGCHQTDTAKTLDTSDQNPSKNQGGVAILYDAYQHHGYREGESVNPLTRDQNESVRGDTSLIVAQDAYDKYTETDKGASVKASGGNYGGVQRI